MEHSNISRYLASFFPHCLCASLCGELYVCGHWLACAPPAIGSRLWCCEAKSTTLRRPSPGDGFENHMYCLCLGKCSLHIPRRSCHFESLCLLMVASWLVAELAFSRVQPAALATQALKDIPLWPLIMLSFTLPLLESSASFICCSSDLFLTKRFECLKTLFSMVKYIHS